MLYLIFGENSYQAIRKIRELKESFKLKGADFLLEEVDGEAEDVSEARLQSLFWQANLFEKARFIILKNILAASPDLFKLINKCGDLLRDSKDIFLFWEKGLKPKTKEYEFFEKYAAKVQETKTLSSEELGRWLVKKASESGIKLTSEEKEKMLAEASPTGGQAGESGEWALENILEKMVLGASPPAETKQGKPPSPFSFVDKIFSAPLGRALLALKEAEVAGIDVAGFIYPMLWKIKTSFGFGRSEEEKLRRLGGVGAPTAASEEKLLDAYWQGILTESAIRRDPKNPEEHLERWLISLK